MNEIKIIEATIDHIDDLSTLNRETFEDNAVYDPIINKDWVVSNDAYQWYKESILNPNVCCLVALIKGKVVGYLIAEEKRYSYRNARIIEIDAMGVKDEYRSMGIGTLLVSVCKNWAKSRKFTRLYVNCYSNNKRALKFYKSVGLSIIDQILESAI